MEIERVVHCHDSSCSSTPKTLHGVFFAAQEGEGEIVLVLTIQSRVQ